MPTAASVRNLSFELIREKHGELSRRKLLVLKEIQLSGRATNRTMVLKLLDDDMISKFHDGTLQLTEGRRIMTVRPHLGMWRYKFVWDSVRCLSQRSKKCCVLKEGVSVGGDGEK